MTSDSVLALDICFCFANTAPPHKYDVRNADQNGAYLKLLSRPRRSRRDRACTVGRRPTHPLDWTKARLGPVLSRAG